MLLSLRDCHVRAINFLQQFFLFTSSSGFISNEMQYSSAFAARQWGYHLLSEIPSKSMQ